MSKRQCLSKVPVLAALSTCVVISMTGCATTSSTPRPTSAQLEQLASGLTDSVQAKQQAWQLQKIQQVLVQRCMQAKGQVYYVTDFGPMPTTSSATADSISPNPIDGYGIYESKEAALRAASGQVGGDKEEAYVLSLNGAAQAANDAAYSGSADKNATIHLPGGGDVTFPTTGCLAQAYGELYGSASEQAEVEAIPQILKASIQQNLAEDSAYTSALQAWQNCMTTQGYSYDSPTDAINKIEQAYSTTKDLDPVHTQEIAVAQADATCDQSTGLRAAKNAARVKALGVVSASLESQTVTLLQVQAQAVQRARALA